MTTLAKLLLNKRLLSNTLGNVLEWYDFTLYGTLAPIIANLFFPSKNALVSLIMTFGAFAAGFLMRPLGGIIYGHIGDRFGRKRALIASIILMTIPTVFLGILPTYAFVGILAPLLVTLTRLLQGIAVGGEFTGTMSFLVETAPDNRRGLAGSFALVGVLAGILLGAVVVTVISIVLPQGYLNQWGWRIPFLLGGVLGFAVWLLRRNLSETPFFEKIKRDTLVEAAPIEKCFTLYKKKLLQGFGITILNAFAFISL